MLTQAGRDTFDILGMMLPVGVGSDDADQVREGTECAEVRGEDLKLKTKNRVSAGWWPADRHCCRDGRSFGCVGCRQDF